LREVEEVEFTSRRLGAGGEEVEEVEENVYLK